MKTAFKIISLLLLFLAGAIGAFAQKKEPVLLIQTNYGDIKIKLYNETPLHRDNFLKLVEKHFYDSLLFHRVINSFMIQGGDPESKHATPEQILGSGDVGYTVPAEFNPKLFHKHGALAAARNPDDINPQQASSGCQFYIVQGKKNSDSLLTVLEKRITNGKASNKVMQNPANKLLFENLNKYFQEGNIDSIKNIQGRINLLTEKELVNIPPYKFSAEQRKTYINEGGTPHLDGSYTVFGEVVQGIEVLDKIAAVPCNQFDRPLSNVVILKISVLKK